MTDQEREERRIENGTEAFRKGHDLPFLSQDMASALEAVERQLEDWASSGNPLVSEISGYLFGQKGKRIRPALVILTERLFGRRSDEEIFHAALLELMHTASLVHDDIVDGSERRRGARTVHARWGPNVTVLLGDYLYIRSMELALASRHKRVIGILTEVSTRMVEGELDEYSVSGRLDTDEKTYLGIIGKKTAALFEACCRIGSILAAAGPAEEEAAARFGLNTGLAFQITDDILDFTSDQASLGKPVFSDVREGRMTPPLIHALETGEMEMRLLIESHFGKKRSVEETARKRLILGLEDLGSLQHARELAQRYTAKALAYLSLFPASAAKTALAGLLDFVGERNY